MYSMMNEFGVPMNEAEMSMMPGSPGKHHLERELALSGAQGQQFLPILAGALIGGLGSWGLGMGPLKGLGGSGWMRNIPSWFGKTGKFGNLLYSGKGADRKFSLGKAGLLGLLGAGTALPFMADEEEEVIETPWETTPDSIAYIRKMTNDRDSILAFLGAGSDIIPSSLLTASSSFHCFKSSLYLDNFSL